MYFSPGKIRALEVVSSSLASLREFSFVEDMYISSKNIGRTLWDSGDKCPLIDYNCCVEEHFILTRNACHRERKSILLCFCLCPPRGCCRYECQRQGHSSRETLTLRAHPMGTIPDLLNTICKRIALFSRCTIATDVFPPATVIDPKKQKGSVPRESKKSGKGVGSILPWPQYHSSPPPVLTMP